MGRPTYTNARLAKGKLIIEQGAYEDLHLRATTSRNGVLRLFASDRMTGEATMYEGRAVKLKSIQINARAGDDTITLDESFPAATVFLNGGNDHLIAGSAAHRIYGGAGDDTIYAGGGDDTIYGESGIDRLFGEGGTDYLDGGLHKDFLDGGSGKNKLIGGDGIDNFTVRSTKDKVDRDARDHVRLLA